MREVKVIFNSMELNPEVYNHWNDKRVNGGRIKFYSRNDIPPQAVQTLEDRLSDMFPRLNVQVQHYGRNVYTVHFKDVKQELIRKSIKDCLRESRSASKLIR